MVFERADHRPDGTVGGIEIDVGERLGGAVDHGGERSGVERTSGRSDRHDLAPAVGGVGATFDEPGSLESAKCCGESAGGLHHEPSHVPRAGGTMRLLREEEQHPQLGGRRALLAADRRDQGLVEPAQSTEEQGEGGEVGHPGRKLDGKLSVKQAVLECEPYRCRMHLRSALAAAAVAIGAVGCAAEAPSPPPTDAVVSVRAGGCESIDRVGVGVAIRTAEGPLIATSAHTVTGSTDIRVQTTEETTATLVAFDAASDIALLTAPDIDDAVPLASAVTVDQPARLVVRDTDGQVTIEEVEIIRRLRVTIEDIFVEVEVERRAFELDRAVQRGESGAPVFDEYGAVLGIVYATSRERQAAFAVRHEEIAALIADQVVPPEAARCR